MLAKDERFLREALSTASCFAAVSGKKQKWMEEDSPSIGWLGTSAESQYNKFSEDTPRKSTVDNLKPEYAEERDELKKDSELRDS